MCIYKIEYDLFILYTFQFQRTIDARLTKIASNINMIHIMYLRNLKKYGQTKYEADKIKRQFVKKSSSPSKTN